ncbi:MAG: hypothetical protein EHM41_08515 [Chloroflexi bacterium]|nr:MAG: hypothetical protein EHM41_08515 [Chloroflexota bacterium]
MNLDEFTAFNQIDPENMLAHIDRLPDQLETAWKMGAGMDLPAWKGISRVLISGMGGSAIGADLVTAFIEPSLRVPVFLHRDYNLPGWAAGEDTLVIASSHSGNTEETLSTFRTALERGCRCLAVTTGGRLETETQKAGFPVWRFEHHGQPRSAVGYSFGLLLSIFARLELIPDPSNEVNSAVTAMHKQQVQIQAHIPVVQNPAKRMAGQLIGRHVAVFGADLLAPVARRWKGQINEVAKAWAQFELLPEADHNTLAGSLFPEDILSRTMALFLRADLNHPRNLLRANLTKQALMLEGVSTDFIDARGDTRMAQQWTCLHFGDYSAYYLAMMYEVDPTPIKALLALKDALQLQ